MAALKNVMNSSKYEISIGDLDAFRKQYEKLGCSCGYFIYDAEEPESINYADEMTASLFGCGSVEEFMTYTGGTFKGMVHPEDYDQLRKVIAAQQQHSSRDIDLVDYRIIRKDGEVRKIRDLAYCAFNGDHKHYYVYMVDITDLEQFYNDNRPDVEKLLRENGMDLQDLDRDDQGIYIADATRKIIYWNKAAEKITGFTRGEMQGLNCFYTALQHQNREGIHMCTGLCPLMRCTLEGETEAEELSALCKNGERKLLTIRTEPLRQDGEICGAIEYFVELEN